MRALVRFLISTLVAGTLFLVPLVLVVLVVGHALKATSSAIRPLTGYLGRERLLGLLAEDLLALVLIAAVFFIAGLFVGTRRGKRWNQFMEQTVLYRVPGYITFRSMARSVPGLDAEDEFAPALVEADGGWAFALIVEQHAHGWVTIFLPDSPTPTSGAVRIVPASRVRRLDAPTLTMMNTLTRSGVGARKLAHLLPLTPEAPTVAEGPASGSGPSSGIDFPGGSRAGESESSNESNVGLPGQPER